MDLLDLLGIIEILPENIDKKGPKRIWVKYFFLFCLIFAIGVFYLNAEHLNNYITILCAFFLGFVISLAINRILHHLTFVENLRPIDALLFLLGWIFFLTSILFALFGYFGVID